jgi:gamma-glutamylcyclotransferase (GGCT)/AIG2-like uncharacterized protein YtfP
MESAQDQQESRLYFAYGSNMNVRQMALRCPGSTPLGKGRLDGWQFRINSRGYATIQPREGATVWGAVWKVDEDDLRSLDRYEGVRLGLYERVELLVERDGMARSRCVVYVDPDGGAGKAGMDYAERVLSGAHALDLPSRYIAYLEKVMN